MVNRKRAWLALAISAGIAGCNALAGIREGVFDPCIEDAGNPTCTGGDVSASSGSGSATTSGSGAGGSQAICGNGALDPGEECDDGDSVAGDGCTQCKVDCDEAGAFKDSKTGHCYWVLPKATSFFESSVKCQYQGGNLAAVTSAPELQRITASVSGPVWIGASALVPTGAFHWLDGEPWDFTAWSKGDHEVEDKDLCVVLEGEPLLFAASDCTLLRKGLCERSPIIGP